MRINIAEQRIKDYFINQWTSNIQQSPKLRTYNLFKKSFQLETYVKLNLLKGERSYLAQLRCGILPLRIETGRYVGKQIDIRTCLFCNKTEIETETHFVVVCDCYSETRRNVFGDIFEKVDFVHLSPDLKLCFLMKHHVRKLCKYVAKAFCHRRSFIYNRR